MTVTAEDDARSIDTREQWARRAARRQGLRLVKARRFDPRALDYGMYWLVPLRDTRPDALNVESGLTLDDVEHRLRGE